MPDPSHRPYEPMTIIRPNAKPALWWLFPWSYARTLHTAANALRSLADRQDKALEMQAHIIAEQSEEIANLRRRVEDLNEALHGPAINKNTNPHKSGFEQIKVGNTGFSFEYRQNKDGSISAVAPHKPNLDV